MTDCQTGNEVSDNMMFVSFKHFILLAQLICCNYFLLDVFHRTLALFVVFFEDFSEEFFLIGEERANVIDGYLFEYHIVLGKCSSLIAKNILDSSQLLRNLTVPC